MNTSAHHNIPADGLTGRPDTLERLLSHCARRSPQKTALSDPPNRNLLEGRSDDIAPGNTSFGQLEETVSRLAARFRALGLKPGDYVALQLPNFSETPALVLALMRARLIPCLIPLSWSIDDLSNSFQRLKPSALISCGQLEGINYSENMRALAFAHLHIRFVMGVGYDIAEGVSDITALFEPQSGKSDETPPARDNAHALDDLALVTYIDPATPVPHSNGQILATGVLLVQELGLSSSDHILSAYPLSSIPGLAAHMYPWLMSGCALGLHHPFDFTTLRQQLESGAFSYFAAPQQVVDWMSELQLALPRILATVRRDSHLRVQVEAQLDNTKRYDLWNLGGVGLVPVNFSSTTPTMGLFPNGALCLPPSSDKQLCVAGARILNGRLYVKGRIFPSERDLKTSLEWISLKKRFEGDWIDTGLAAFPGSQNSILLGGNSSDEWQQAAS